MASAIPKATHNGTDDAKFQKDGDGRHFSHSDTVRFMRIEDEQVKASGRNVTDAEKSGDQNAPAD